ncbi:hypothetical protein Tco_0738144 [Tanacetum coccineum]
MPQPVCSLRTSLLDDVCEIVGRIETNDITNIISQMEEIESQLSAVEAAKINVSWLRGSLNGIHKRNKDGIKADFVVVFEENTGKADMVPVSDENMHVSDDGVKDEFVCLEACSLEAPTGMGYLKKRSWRALPPSIESSNSLSEILPPPISCHVSSFSESVPSVSQSRFAIKGGGPTLDAALRTSLLDDVCEIVGRIETNDITNIISQMEEIESQLSAVEAAKINVSWLRGSLNAIHKRNKDGIKADFVVVFEENTGKADLVPVSDENMHVSDDGVKDEFVVVPNSKLTGREFHLFGE